MKVLVIYGSHHHGSTKKLVEAIAERHPVDMVGAQAQEKVEWDDYDLIGFASGIDFGKFYPAVTDKAKRLPEGKAVFALYTCAKDSARYGDEILKIAAERNCIPCGKFGCRGYNTYGPWKLIGGMYKGHPNVQEQEAALHFFEELLKTIANK